jgi:Sec-independent protein secretion pathway component TatC
MFIRYHFVVLLGVHSLFHSEFSTECNIALPVSVYSILLFSCGHPVATYVFFPVSPSLLSFQNVLYEGVSKIFRTGAAIYTAVVAARSIGRW